MDKTFFCPGISGAGALISKIDINAAFDGFSHAILYVSWEFFVLCVSLSSRREIPVFLPKKQ
jgi:hypothetical protein